jgi:hypothetical protein
MSIKVAYLIQAHKSPELLQRMINALADAESAFYIHIDAKSTVDFSSVHSSVSAIHFVERINVHWGGWSQVEASLNLLKAAVLSGAGRYHLLSGQDFPIAPRAAIKHYFDNDQNYIEYFSLPAERWYGNWRIDRYHFIDSFAGRSPAFKERFEYVMNLLRRVALRKMLPGIQPYGGSSWWSITKPCADAIISLCHERPEVVRFFKYTKCPDELFFQTVIMNSAQRSLTVNHNARYIRWVDNSHPEILALSDFEGVKQSGMMFARKFENERSGSLLQAIEDSLDATSS